MGEEIPRRTMKSGLPERIEETISAQIALRKQESLNSFSMIADGPDDEFRRSNTKVIGFPQQEAEHRVSTRELGEQDGL
ncbi:unnamed protein product [Protopolystoma xenopodis]|uniref:Uncharacterized protein n=1 Tax=Protopolystoma xenopodis TaxID=117903 RepID=A0A3S5B8U4_9PLAT|nr:unnamed protein product [Protopolystoma xenopodis]